MLHLILIAKETFPSLHYLKLIIDYFSKRLPCTIFFVGCRKMGIWNGINIRRCSGEFQNFSYCVSELFFNKTILIVVAVLRSYRELSSSVSSWSFLFLLLCCSWGVKTILEMILSKEENNEALGLIGHSRVAQDTTKWLKTSLFIFLKLKLAENLQYFFTWSWD